MLRALPLLAALATAASAQAPPPHPVLFVHGLASHDRTWDPTFDHLAGLGWGEPVTYHADLNVSDASTDWADDVRVSPPARTRDFAHGTDATLDADATALRDAPPGTLVFAVNFEAVYDADADLFRPHAENGTAARSASNQAAVAKQAAALSMIVPDLLAWTGADRVIVVGHSMGGLAIREYLQRHRDGSPRWWSPGVGHGVAAAVTVGTPHQGTRVQASFLQDLLGAVSISEAMRDLRTQECFDGCFPGRFLWGSAGAAGSAGDTVWHNLDVDADGDPDGPDSEPVDGLNAGDFETDVAVDPPEHPLPLDVAYVYVRSVLDGVTPYDRQALRTADGSLAPTGAAVYDLRSFAVHTAQTASVAIVTDAVLAPFLSVAAEAGPAAEALRLWPNPARDAVSLRATLAASGPARVEVWDALGRRVASVDLGDRPAGPLDVRLDVSALAAGAYAAVVVSETGRPTARLVVAR